MFSRRPLCCATSGQVPSMQPWRHKSLNHRACNDRRILRCRHRLLLVPRWHQVLARGRTQWLPLWLATGQDGPAYDGMHPKERRKRALFCSPLCISLCRKSVLLVKQLCHDVMHLKFDTANKPSMDCTPMDDANVGFYPQKFYCDASIPVALYRCRLLAILHGIVRRKIPSESRQAPLLAHCSTACCLVCLSRLLLRTKNDSMCIVIILQGKKVEWGDKAPWKDLFGPQVTACCEWCNVCS